MTGPRCHETRSTGMRRNLGVARCRALVRRRTVSEVMSFLSRQDPAGIQRMHRLRAGSCRARHRAPRQRANGERNSGRAESPAATPVRFWLRSGRDCRCHLRLGGDRYRRCPIRRVAFCRSRANCSGSNKTDQRAAADSSANQHATRGAAKRHDPRTERRVLQRDGLAQRHQPDGPGRAREARA